MKETPIHRLIIDVFGNYQTFTEQFIDTMTVVWSENACEDRDKSNAYVKARAKDIAGIVYCGENYKITPGNKEDVMDLLADFLPAFVDRYATEWIKLQ